jgi:hypothetical protein
MMSSRLRLALGLLLAGCATGPTGALGEGEVRVAALEMPARVDRGGSVLVKFTGVQRWSPDVRPVRGCFIWSTSQRSDGPFCAPVEKDDPKAREIGVRLTPRDPNDYRVSGYLEHEYKGELRKSNTVSGSLSVR